MYLSRNAGDRARRSQSFGGLFIELVWDSLRGDRKDSPRSPVQDEVDHGQRGADRETFKGRIGHP